MAGGFWTGGPHPTSNLPGYPARDYGAPGGTLVYAWDELRVRRISGSAGYRGGGFGGFQLYLTDRYGGEYFVTHVENLLVKAGDTLRPGQPLARVGNYGTPHVHVGYTRGDPVDTLGLRPEYLYSGSGATAGAKAIAERGPRLGAGGTATMGFPDAAVKEVGKVLLVPGYGLGKALDVAGAGGIADVVTAPADALKWLFGNWDRALEVLGGGLLVVVGLVLMGRSLGVTKQRIEVVERRLPGELSGMAPAARETRIARAPRRRVPLPGDEPRVRAPGKGPSEEIPF